MAAEWARTAELEHRKSAEATNQFLRDMLGSVDPSRALGREVTVRYILDEAAVSLDLGALADQPAVEAAVRVALGETYDVLGLYAPAERQLGKAIATQVKHLGRKHEETLRSQSMLAGVLNSQLRYAEAERLAREALESLTTVMGAEHAVTLTTQSHLAVALAGQNKLDEAEAVQQRTLQSRRRVSGADHVDTLRALVHLASVYHAQNRLPEAESLLRSALESAKRALGAEHPEVTNAMNQLARVHESQGNYAEAEALFAETWELDKRVLGAEHPRTQVPMNNLLRVLRIQGKHDETRPIIVARLEHLRIAAARPDAPASSLNSYAWELLTCTPADLRDARAALPVALRCVALNNGKDANFLETLALAYVSVGEAELAIETQRRRPLQSRRNGATPRQHVDRKRTIHGSGVARHWRTGRLGRQDGERRLRSGRRSADLTGRNACATRGAGRCGADVAGLPGTTAKGVAAGPLGRLRRPEPAGRGADPAAAVRRGGVDVARRAPRIGR
jgi:tetratricopeptide (TPR) repeat protein